MPFTSPLWDSMERRHLRATVAAFTGRHILPHQDDWERDGLIPRATHLVAAELGLFGLGVPEEVGGSGGDLIDATIMAEEMLYRAVTDTDSCRREIDQAAGGSFVEWLRARHDDDHFERAIADRVQEWFG